MLKDLLHYESETVFLKTLLKEITENGIIVESEEESREIAADTVVLSVGCYSKNSLY